MPRFFLVLLKMALLFFMIFFLLIISISCFSVSSGRGVQKAISGMWGGGGYTFH